MVVSSRVPPRAAIFVSGYLALWGAATAYLAAKGADWTLPAISLGVFGVALPLLSLPLTRQAAPPRIVVARPRLELGAILGFLILYAVGFLVWGMSATRAAVPAGREQELLVLAVKLLVHVAAPALLLAALGAKVAALFSLRVQRPGFWPPLLVLGAIILALMCVVSPALGEIAALHASVATLIWAAPASFIWLAVEAGLCEEFLFRAVLQTDYEFENGITLKSISSYQYGVVKFNIDTDGTDTFFVRHGKITVQTFAFKATPRA